ncbi:hypothetical protein RCL1_008908 [Eukaryota sp. TZLM3-RCL]
MRCLLLLSIALILALCSETVFNNQFIHVGIEKDKSLSAFISSPASPAHTHFALKRVSYLPDSKVPEEVTEIPLHRYEWSVRDFSVNPDEITFNAHVLGHDPETQYPDVVFAFTALDVPTDNGRFVTIAATVNEARNLRFKSSRLVIDYTIEASSKHKGNHIKYRPAVHYAKDKSIDFGYALFDYGALSTSMPSISLSQSSTNHFSYTVSATYTLYKSGAAVSHSYSITPEEHHINNVLKYLMIIIGLVCLMGGLFSIIIVNNMVSKKTVSMDLELLEESFIN